MPIRNGVVLSLVATLSTMVQTVVIADESAMPPLRADQTAYLALYRELVETNTTLSAGSCTVAAEHIAAHLKSAGFEDKDITLFSVPDHPKEGGIVAVLQGSSKSAKPMLLLGHLDVVEAKAEDWSVDPFKLTEQEGWFYGRGSIDMKDGDAALLESLIRLKREHFVRTGTSSRLLPQMRKRVAMQMGRSSC